MHGRLSTFSFLFLLLLYYGSCKSNCEDYSKNTGLIGAGTFSLNEMNYTKADMVDWAENFILKDSSKTYAEVKADIVKLKSKIKTEAISTDSLGRLFTDVLVYQIIPYWYGTTWSFEGHTAIPNQGEIACGYFVSTTLLHAGLNINRYKLAQQLPVHEAASLCLQDSALIISHAESAEIISEIYDKTQEGVYFLGFDGSHVGFLIKKPEGIFLLHSNYIGGAGVTVEKIEESEAFSHYHKFYICPLSTNGNFLKCWQLNTPIVVVETP